MDTFLYAQVLDVQLDTFPFASGFTSARVMGAGKPVVTLCTQESVTSSLATYHKIFVSDLVPEEIRRDYEEIFTFENGNVTYPFCEKIEEYEELSDKIIRDDDFRKNLGCRCRKWVEKYFLDHKSSAVTTVELLDEVSGL